MFSFLSYNFVILALVISLLIAVSSAILSPFLVLDGQALIADGLAHIGFTGIVVGLLFVDQPLLISIPFSIVFSILIKFLIRNKNINGDAALGLLSSISLAVGLIIIHKSTGFNQSIETMLVGNLWTVTKLEVILALIVFVLILIFIIFNYNDLLLLTFDFKYAKFKKVKHVFLSYTLAALTAVLISIGVKTIGTLLISAFIIFPVIIGMQFKRGFKISLLIGVLTSIFTVFFGMFFGDLFDIPAGSSIVLVYGLVLFLTMFLNKIFKWGEFRD